MRPKALTTLMVLLLTLPLSAQVRIKVKSKSPQAEYAATRLSRLEGDYTIEIKEKHKGPAEGFTLKFKNKKVQIIGNDANGIIHGANSLVDHYITHGHTLKSKEKTFSSAPDMVMRGACVGLQKPTYLPGHKVYEYPITPENFPWFYDKALWLRYLDLLAESDMNSLYLWNGHPFASLVKVDDYPFAPEVDDATMAKNQEMYDFLTTEAARRGIRVIQMFYNIIVSKPFADHYGIETQDRHRPITPLIADYTRKSISAFVQRYPNVGFLVCLGEAMEGIDTDIEWMTGTIIPGLKDGLAASGRNDTPPIILRSHDTDAVKVLEKALPLYPNIYTMSKYNGESLTTYSPNGPWGETHRKLASAAPVHIDNVHIMANLEPWRWSSPSFIRKAVNAMHIYHNAKGLHIYPQASYWDWPYTADKTHDGTRLLQIDRDWLWYKAFGHSAWKKSYVEEDEYWCHILAEHFHTDSVSASILLKAYNEMGEIAPKLLRRFGITDGNRQTLLLGMTMPQLINPSRFNVYPGFRESCAPKGETLAEYVEKSVRREGHTGELPLEVTLQCVKHGENAVGLLYKLRHSPVASNPEFIRLYNDACCYMFYARSFRFKALAADIILEEKIKGKKNFKGVEAFMNASIDYWEKLARITEDTYLYANSMQTAQRRIPIGGDNGQYKTWSEMLPVYKEELANFEKNVQQLRNPEAPTPAEELTVANPAKVRLQYAGRPEGAETANGTPSTVTLRKNALPYQGREERIDSVAPELEGLEALILNRDTTRIEGTTVVFDCDEPVQMLVGFFRDDDPKWAKAPQLETDASANEFGQAEPVILNAINMTGMPTVNIHAYHFGAGHHVVRLPKGIIMVAGFTTTDLKPRDANLHGAGNELDWLFEKN
ncbi:MAG: hypothetical protein J5548_09035 [Prevotella sp.]|nr:hypothetical protein [Prevotella sp.]